MLIYTFTNACTFPANWSGARGSVQTNPAATWTANVKKNGSTVGTIQVSTGGAFTFATTGGSTVTFASGDEITIVAPSTLDTSLQGFSATLYTSTGGYVQAGGDIGGGTAASPIVIAVNGYSAARGNDDTGSANAYAVSTPYTFSLVKYAQVTFKAANSNTGASTLVVNGGSAIAIKKGGSTALASGDISSGQMVTVFYDGTNWQMTSWSGASGGGSGGGIPTNYYNGTSSTQSVGSAPTTPTAIDSTNLSITLPASGSAKKWMLNAMVTWSNSHGMRGHVYLDSTECFIQAASTNGVNPVATNDGQEALVWSGVVITQPGDSASHTVKLYWEAQGSTGGFTLEDRWMVLVQLA